MNDKLNYLSETKSAIKDAISAKGVSVSENDTFRSYANKIQEISSSSLSGDICDIGLALHVDETNGLRRLLNGSIVSINKNTQAFLAKLKEIQLEQPDLFVTEEQWQATKTANDKGLVNSFVINEDAGTIRLPNFPDYVVSNVTAKSSSTSTPSGTLTVNVLGNGKVLGLYSAKNSAITLKSWSDGAELDTKTKLGHALPTSEVSGFNRPTNGYPVGVAKSAANSGLTGNVDIGSGKVVTTTSTTTSLNTEIRYKYFIIVNTGQTTTSNITNEAELNNPFTYGMSQYFKGDMSNLSWLKSLGQYTPKADYSNFYTWVLTNARNNISGFKLSTASDITDYDFVVNDTDETFRLPLKNGQEGMFANAAVPTGYNLYYYVGVTVQNEGLINAGKLSEGMAELRASKSDKPVWTISDFVISNYVAVGSTTVDISSSIPDDDYGYELLVRNRMQNSSNNANNVYQRVSIDGKVQFEHISDGTANDSSMAGVIYLPPHVRSITLTNTGTSNQAANSRTFSCYGYKRIDV